MPQYGWNRDAVFRTKPNTRGVAVGFCKFLFDYAASKSTDRIEGDGLLVSDLVSENLFSKSSNDRDDNFPSPFLSYVHTAYL